MGNELENVDVFTTREVAEILEVSRQAIKDYVYAGKLSPLPARSGDRESLFSRSEVTRFVQERFGSK